MTTLFSHASPAAALVTEVSETASAISSNVQRQIDRLAASLCSGDDTPRCILMMEVGEGKDSSLWLATATAAILGAKIKRNVHVLSVEAAAGTRGAVKKASLRFSGARNFTLEQIENLYADRESTGTISDRIASLHAANQPVIVFLAQDQALADILPSAASIDGVVLLVRASKARRAALLAIEERLRAAQVKLFGAVLLDRTYPIPDALYRLL